MKTIRIVSRFALLAAFLAMGFAIAKAQDGDATDTPDSADSPASVMSEGTPASLCCEAVDLGEA